MPKLFVYRDLDQLVFDLLDSTFGFIALYNHKSVLCAIITT